jgi:hypothetical protein
MSNMPTRCLKGTRHSLPIYNPIGFDPQEVLPLFLHRYADYVRYFLHVLYTQRVFKDVKDEFVPLKAAYLRRFFPDNRIYKQIRDALLDSKAIICDGVCYPADTPIWRNHNQQHRPGKSFGYKLGPRWQGVRHEQIFLTTKPLLRSVNKIKKLRQSEIVLFPHEHIWRCLQDITIDYQAVLRELDALINNATPEEIDGYIGQRMICDGINNGDWFWHVCHFGRVYNNLTSLKKWFRQYLRANNHSLVGCDVVNSQPLLVGLLCRHIKQELLANNSIKSMQLTQSNHYELDQDLLDRISLSYSQNQEEERGGGEGNSLYDVVLTKSSQMVPDDLERYIQLCEEGRFYDELIALDNNQTDRDAFKKQLFTQVFYGKNCYEGRLTSLFAQEFPTVWETIQTIKKEDYHRLSHQMLRLEAEIIINRAIRQCAMEGIWVVTIHDCLVTFPEEAERVKEIMVGAFGSVGVIPTIKIKSFNWNDQNERRIDLSSWVDQQSQFLFRFNRQRRRRSGEEISQGDDEKSVQTVPTQSND